MSTFDSQHSRSDDTFPVGDAVTLPPEVYEQIVRRVQELCDPVPQGNDQHAPRESHSEATRSPTSESEDTPGGTLAPPRPTSLSETGLSVGDLSALVLKATYLHGSLTGFEIASQLRLPFSVVDEGLRFLADEQCLEVLSGETVGRLSFRFRLTDRGRIRAREEFEECRYVGPAPVSLASYVAQCQRQRLSEFACHREQIERALGDLVVPDAIISALGAALCAGRSLFLYGPSGNGKTAIARRLGVLINTLGSEIYVPYAISVDHSIITIYDPKVHFATDSDLPLQSPSGPATADETTSDSESESRDLSTEIDFDRRWRRIQRPVITCAGDLTLDMLELRFHEQSRYYTAPLHIKANGGLFLLDDFGRQLVPPVTLLNRWILPLEERIDHLTLATGRRVEVPFEQLVVFSTNLTPENLVDPAFLRRIRHKIAITPPDDATYHRIFRNCCERIGIPYSHDVVSRLLARSYDRNIPRKASDPRDLLEAVIAICRFRQEKSRLDDELVNAAFETTLEPLATS